MENITIKSFLPNPKGTDTGAEYIVLTNSGTNEISLRSWSLKTKNGKKALLPNESIAPGEDMQFFAQPLKLRLGNSGETLSLYTPDGTLADEVGYEGQAVEGRLVEKKTTLTKELYRELFDDGFEKITTQANIQSFAITPALVAEWIVVGVFFAIIAAYIIHTYAKEKKDIFS